jgi:hypothetical protein
VVAACGAVRASAGSRRWSCSYSGAGPRPLFVARPLSKVERGRMWWAGAQATNRGDRGARAGMLGPPRQPQPGSVSGLARGGEPPAGARELRWERGCLREGVACRHGGRRNAVWMRGPGGDLPAVGGELAGDRDRDDPAGLAARVFELAPAGVEPALGAPGDVDDLGRLPALAAPERFTDDRAGGSGRRPRPAAVWRAWSRPW